MDKTALKIASWLIALPVTWLTVRAIISVMTDHRTNNTKAMWIAFIVCTPVIGPVIYWFFGGVKFGDQPPRV